MRGKSSGNKKEMEADDRIDKEPQLSGAYIRSLVKQLTSSRTNKESGVAAVVDGVGEQSQHPQPQPQQPREKHKKQVRRRLHTTRPYQERLLNMAEARREIVTALKFHRASMKQQQQQQLQQHQEEIQMEVEMETGSSRNSSKSRRNLRVYATNNASNFSNSAEVSENFNLSYPVFNPYTWPVSPVSSVPVFQDNNSLNFVPLPNQTLGLNLNFQDFSNLDTPFYQIGNNPSSIYSSASSQSTSSTSSVSLPPADEGPAIVPACMPELINDGGDYSGSHQAMDDKDIAEIRSIGDQHQMEWNDTLSLVTSAWWFKFLKAAELGPEEKLEEENSYGCFPFDEITEFPPWLNPNESCLDYHSDDYLQDPALPCMDIEEIEAMDGEWLA